MANLSVRAMFGTRVTLGEAVNMSWWEVRHLMFPAEAIAIDDCSRIGCQERGACGCLAVKLRPRVIVNYRPLEFYANHRGGVWMLGGDRASRRKISKRQRARVLARDGHRCGWCERREELEIDHIVPVSRGGSNDDSNLQTLCRKCNRAKGTDLTEAVCA